MAKSVTVSKSTQEGTSLDKLKAEGKTLNAIWKSRQTAQRKLFTADTKADGFDTRLGKLLQELKAQSPLDSGQISRQTLATYHVDKIDRRRRSEALWFVENEVDCRDFIKKSKKGYTSLSALQKAMYKASKEAKANSEAEATTEQPSKEEVSDVGQSKSKPSKDDIVKSIIKACQYSGIDLLDIAEALMEIDTVSEAEEAETKEAA
tara:strand:+ start:43 stop:660 length:618 start_codon:yes stop_codon:yes gene_type:complete